MQIVLALITGAGVVLMLHIYRRTTMVGNFWADEIGAELIYIKCRAIEAGEGNLKRLKDIASMMEVPLFDFDSMLWHFWVPLGWYREQWSKMLDESLDEELQGYRKEYHEGRKSCT